MQHFLTKMSQSALKSYILVNVFQAIYLCRRETSVGHHQYVTQFMDRNTKWVEICTLSQDEILEDNMCILYSSVSDVNTRETSNRGH